jgi:hypothetical protein
MTEITYLPCSVEHIALINPQPGDEMEKAVFLRPEFRYLVDQGTALSAWVNSRCICAAGVYDLYPHRGLAWSVLSCDAGPYMLQLTRKIRSFMNLYHAKRVELYVASDFEEGHRWAKAIGFKCETPEPMIAHGVFGHDETMYVRIKP